MGESRWPAWLALVAGIGVAAYAISAQNPPEAEPIDAPRQVFSAARAMKHVEAIAREPHPTGSPQIAEVREYLLKTLRDLGLEPEVQAPRDASKPERNIVARLVGKGPRGRKAILLCAHYDSVRMGPGAGDNASGVAAVLETLRALKAGPGLDRDVIVLIDDGEEVGLLGASLFVEEHPWAVEVGVVLNVDARGNHGPSIMFETSQQNGWLMHQFAVASPHPVATSLSMDVYRLLPNDTNLTIFKRAGIDGLNFAFTRGLAYYHSPEDTPANLDPRSLQHQGENVLAMTNRLGRLELEDIRREEVVYFSVLARGLVAYPVSLATPLSMVPLGLFALATIVGLARGRVKFADLLVGIAIVPLTVAAAIFAVGGFWVVLKDMLSPFGIPFVKFDLAILAACSLVASTVTLSLTRSAAKGRSLEAISLGALAWWVALAVATARYLPGMSYLFTWPGAFTLLGLVLAMRLPRGSGWSMEAAFLGCVPALLMLPPLALDALLGLNLRLAAPQMLIVVLFLGPVLPLLGPIITTRRIP